MYQHSVHNVSVSEAIPWVALTFAIQLCLWLYLRKRTDHTKTWIAVRVIAPLWLPLIAGVFAWSNVTQNGAHVIIPNWGLTCTIAVIAYFAIRVEFKARPITAACTVFLLYTILKIPGIWVVHRPLHQMPQLWFEYRLSLTLAVLCAIYLAWRLIENTFIWVARGDEGKHTCVPADERERTLRMVEEGKITSEEGAELLKALGQSSDLQGQEQFSRHDFMLLIGVAILIVGFFLPWSKVSITLPGAPQVSGVVSGNQVGTAGWAIFILGILAAVPIFVTPKDLLYKISMLQIFLVLIGTALLVSFLIRSGTSMQIGLPICFVGFAVMLIAGVVKMKKLSA
jgi:hypothetical protein